MWYLFIAPAICLADVTPCTALKIRNPWLSKHIVRRFQRRVSGNWTLTSPMKVAIVGCVFEATVVSVAVMTCCLACGATWISFSSVTVGVEGATPFLRVVETIVLDRRRMKRVARLGFLGPGLRAVADPLESGRDTRSDPLAEVQAGSISLPASVISDGDRPP